MELIIYAALHNRNIYDLFDMLSELMYNTVLNQKITKGEKQMLTIEARQEKKNLFKALRKEAATQVVIGDIFVNKYNDMGPRIEYFQVVAKNKNIVSIQEIYSRKLNNFVDYKSSYLADLIWNIDISDSITKKIQLVSKDTNIVLNKSEG